MAIIQDLIDYHADEAQKRLPQRLLDYDANPAPLDVVLQRQFHLDALDFLRELHKSALLRRAA